MNDATFQTRLAAEGALTPGGEFEILAISAGEGNGWQFSAAALCESVALWDGAECFVDHAWRTRSVRDLAGVLSAPHWDEARQGVLCKLRAVGPSGPLLAELGRQMLRDPEENRPRVGFSADVVFTAQDRQVQKILRVLSVDLVFNPARGGAFVRALNSAGIQPHSTFFGGNSIMETIETSNSTPSTEALKLCANLLDATLSAARLPAPVTERVRKQFSGKVFQAEDLTQAVQDARAMLSELNGAQVVQGPGRISGMVSSEDQVTAAVHDLLGAERPEDLRGVRPHRLTGIRELYTLMTGDYGFTGGFAADRQQFSTTADLPGLLKNAMNKLIIQEWQELGRSGYRWWEPVVTVEHFNSLQAITGVLVGEVTQLPKVSEGAAYTALPVSDSAETGNWEKYGGYIGLTLEMFERDETHRLRQYPRKLASASLRRISSLVASVFTANGGVGPLMADGLNVFDAGHQNLDVNALSAASWEAASAAIYNQEMLVALGGTAPKLALDAKYCLVPRGLRLTAQQILYPSFVREANIFSENLQRGEMGDVITCPEFTDANNWAAVADPRLAPSIILGERFGVFPEIVIADGETNGTLFTHDELRMKVRHWVSVFVADYRPLFKANVAN